MPFHFRLHRLRRRIRLNRFCRFPLSAFRLPRFHHARSLPRLRLPHIPVLTGVEKTAVTALILILSTGAALRAWERSGVQLGPVEDWDTLRSMVIRARDDLEKTGGDTAFACTDPGMQTANGAVSNIHFTSTAKKMPPAGSVDLNRAGEKLLRSLPGVGPTTARAILAHRETHGPFRTPEDLLQVKGIGPKKLEALRPYVTATGQTGQAGQAGQTGPLDDSSAPPPRDTPAKHPPPSLDPRDGIPGTSGSPAARRDL